ncbi:ABC transporter ATP-binding protein [Babesia caballi]|uniref:ABC transporter ATP-binding protein n=1 Tax=Babesia caballi TaxID=5871 RepID=A0AAV4LPK7_BABCB|nr:ABC transporter ATP-binding protein [Babesia caballi]
MEHVFQNVGRDGPAQLVEHLRSALYVLWEGVGLQQSEPEASAQLGEGLPRNDVLAGVDGLHQEEVGDPEDGVSEIPAQPSVTFGGLVGRVCGQPGSDGAAADRAADENPLVAQRLVDVAQQHGRAGLVRDHVVDGQLHGDHVELLFAHVCTIHFLLCEVAVVELGFETHAAAALLLGVPPTGLHDLGEGDVDSHQLAYAHGGVLVEVLAVAAGEVQDGGLAADVARNHHTLHQVVVASECLDGGALLAHQLSGVVVELDSFRGVSETVRVEVSGGLEVDGGRVEAVEQHAQVAADERYDVAEPVRLVLDQALELLSELGSRDAQLHELSAAVLHDVTIEKRKSGRVGLLCDEARREALEQLFDGQFSQLLVHNHVPVVHDAEVPLHKFVVSGRDCFVVAHVAERQLQNVAQRARVVGRFFDR